MSSIWVVCPVENFGVSGLFHFCLRQNADILTIVFSENGNSGGKKYFENVGIYHSAFPNEK